MESGHLRSGVTLIGSDWCNNPHHADHVESADGRAMIVLAHTFGSDAWMNITLYATEAELRTIAERLAMLADQVAGSSLEVASR